MSDGSAMRHPVLMAVLAAAAALQQTPAPSPLAGNGLQSTLKPLPSITSPNTLSGLKPVSDPAPLCRARCAQENYTCDGDDAQCGTQLRQCRRGCSGGR